MQDSILTTVVKDIDGEVTTLEKYAGNVLLIVNVASKCGLTPQYEQLENIQKAWADRSSPACSPLFAASAVPGLRPFQRRVCQNGPPENHSAVR